MPLLNVVMLTKTGSEAGAIEITLIGFGTGKVLRVN
jgi:hypothetical protein